MRNIAHGHGLNGRLQRAETDAVDDGNQQKLLQDRSCRQNDNCDKQQHKAGDYGNVKAKPVNGFADQRTGNQNDNRINGKKDADAFYPLRIGI